ncbi:gem-associated protein 8 isoform X2 [Erinaceus europaeus]|uniref:Gem-associated protein 8 isoform X2 n=1 Tax=Erinaceus europaeus TaxID=9365 RepID=A0ABM3WR16_ERIEU|nr:gem-associated protein 8 isoform X2 [Erinaceus europaeus]
MHNHLLGFCAPSDWQKQEMETEGEPAEAASKHWCFHPAYSRYWHHYHRAMAWMRRHQSAYRKAVQAYYTSLWYFQSQAPPQDPGATAGGPPKASQDPCCGYYQPPWAGPQDKQGRGQEESDSEGVECDVSNMEITDELRQFFKETERHRQERRRQQELDDERLKEYIYADHGLYDDTPRSSEPPSERPGERRQAEMKILYGASAAKIQAMEAAVQLSFNKYCDSKKPKYWPVIPLKF